ncbi:hypothetical protein [Glutamicibacter nicotianae]|uniref:hypothetical protein n=1 Tax=Glutamicibacter nicotianae TaxID=37929 RepID=UPI0025575AD4|nr:hypothetical protein [Glutamicibacter nicotianae]WIV43053.1 hypothetical protein QQS42_12115 [Glutamicibacter nicotianae]
MAKPQLTKKDLEGMTHVEVLQADKDGQLQLLKQAGRQVTPQQFVRMSPDARHQALEDGLLNELFGIDPIKNEA